MKYISLILLILAGITTATRPAKSNLLSRTFKFKNWGVEAVEADAAWKLTKSSKRITVAVIDTGIELSHEGLTTKSWSDPFEKFTTVYGWNFVTDRPNPSDDHGHGTHVAGIIASNSTKGAVGVAPNVSLMSVKYYSDANPGSVNLKNTIRAINYAVDHGAKIINYSGGGPEFSEDEYLAIKRAESKGVLFVASAGNEHANIDLVTNYYYPCAYRLSNVICVAATDIREMKILSSNYGPKHIDVSAPGENIFSLLPGNRYGYMSGTSQATAFVSGLAALLLSEQPELKPSEVKALIVDSSDRLPSLKQVSRGGRINARKAVLLLKKRRDGVSGITRFTDLVHWE